MSCCHKQGPRSLFDTAWQGVTGSAAGAAVEFDTAVDLNQLTGEGIHLTLTFLLFSSDISRPPGQAGREKQIHSHDSKMKTEQSLSCTHYSGKCFHEQAHFSSFSPFELLCSGVAKSQQSLHHSGRVLVVKLSSMRGKTLGPIT